MKTEYDQVKAILKKHNALNMEIEEVVDNTELYDELYKYFQEEMPYGVQKARTGMPDEWIADRLFELELVYDQEKVDEYNNDYAQRKAY